MVWIFLFLGWVAAELFVIVKVAEAVGIPLTILLLIAGWPIGVWVLRLQGRAAWRRFSAAVSEGRRPGREAVDGALVVFGASLLIIPGFITDVVGILALLPPTRGLMRALLIRNLRSRAVVRVTRRGGAPPDVDSTARDLDQPRLQP